MDEDPMQSLERELLEEAGLSKNDYRVVANDNYPKLKKTQTFPAPFSLVIYKYGNTPHKHIDLPYVVQSKTSELRPQSGESMQIDWFTLEQIRELYAQEQMNDATMDMCEWIFENYL